jgi:hypothetical protein
MAGVSIVTTRPDRKTGSVIIAGIIKPVRKSTRGIITITALVICIGYGGGSFAGNAPVESVVPSLLVHIVRVESVGIFFKEIRIITCGKTAAIATFHKTHLVARRLLHTDHGIHLRHAGRQHGRRTLSLVPALIMGITSR